MNTEENIKTLKRIAKKISDKLHCDRHGSCVHFAEIFVEEVNDQHPELLNDFDVIEGYVNAKFGNGIPQEHTWIRLNNGDIIDPTFSQFDKYDKNAQYSKKRTKVYSGQKYYDEGKEGSWFSERRKKLPSMVFKEGKRESIKRILKEEDRYDDKVGKTFWFEYHCYESPESCDAEIWYRSHQKVKVIGVSEWSYDDKEWRQEDGNPRVYLVEWEDGFQYDVFEDELMESPNEFYRPSPPKRKIQESIKRILREENFIPSPIKRRISPEDIEEAFDEALQRMGRSMNNQNSVIHKDKEHTTLWLFAKFVIDEMVTYLEQDYFNDDNRIYFSDDDYYHEKIRKPLLRHYGKRIKEKYNEVKSGDINESRFIQETIKKFYNKEDKPRGKYSNRLEKMTTDFIGKDKICDIFALYSNKTYLVMVLYNGSSNNYLDEELQNFLKTIVPVSLFTLITDTNCKED
jgi:hypothetical protein